MTNLVHNWEGTKTTNLNWLARFLVAIKRMEAPMENSLISKVLFFFRGSRDISITKSSITTYSPVN